MQRNASLMPGSAEGDAQRRRWAFLGALRRAFGSPLSHLSSRPTRPQALRRQSLNLTHVCVPGVASAPESLSKQWVSWCFCPSPPG